MGKNCAFSTKKRRRLRYTFDFDEEGRCLLRLHPKTIVKLKARLKQLTGRSNGMGYAQRKKACGVPKWQAQRHGWVKGYWRAAGMWDCTRAMNNRNLYRAGYRCLMDYYVPVS